MRGFLGCILGIALWIAFVWASGAFMAWDVKWFLQMADWTMYGRFMFGIFFCFIAFYFAAFWACMMERA